MRWVPSQYGRRDGRRHHAAQLCHFVVYEDEWHSVQDVYCDLNLNLG